jgi:hypothetical protein
MHRRGCDGDKEKSRGEEKEVASFLSVAWEQSSSECVVERVAWKEEGMVELAIFRQLTSLEDHSPLPFPLPPTC